MKQGEMRSEPVTLAGEGGARQQDKQTKALNKHHLAPVSLPLVWLSCWLPGRAG